MYSIPFENRPKQLGVIQAVDSLTKDSILPLAGEIASHLKVSIETIYKRVAKLSKITGKQYFRPMEIEMRVKKIQDSKNAR